MLRNFHLYVEKDYDALSLRAAEIFADEVNKKPAGAFGFATGSTPIGMYKALIEMQKTRKANLTEITAFNLDEYYPIKKDDDQSYCYFMRQNLFDGIGLSADKTFIPRGDAPDPVAECTAYDEKIAAAGGIEMQILGLGANGHIGFNEPDSKLVATTYYVPLAESTIQSNARFFASPEDVPRHALTMGLNSIMMAKRIILLVSGEGKASILKEVLGGPITTMVPGSLLQLHRDVTVVIDEAAGKLL